MKRSYQKYIKPSKPKKYVEGGGVNPYSSAFFNELDVPESERAAQYRQDQDKLNAGFAGLDSAGNSIPVYGWIAQAANMGKNMAKGMVDRNEYGVPKTTKGALTDAIATPTHEQALYDIKNNEGGMGAVRAGLKVFNPYTTIASAAGNWASTALGKQGETAGMWGQVNKFTGVKNLDEHGFDLNTSKGRAAADEYNRMEVLKPALNKFNDAQRSANMNMFTLNTAAENPQGEKSQFGIMKQGGKVSHTTIEVEGNELMVNPKTGKVITDYSKKPSHAKGGFVTNAEVGNHIIRSKDRTAYLEGDKTDKNTIIMNGVKRQNQAAADEKAILDIFEAGGAYYKEKFGSGGTIHIKPANRGKFTEAAKRAGMDVQEYASHVLNNKDKYSSTLEKRAQFAKNAASFKHGNGGEIQTLTPGQAQMAAKALATRGTGAMSVSEYNRLSPIDKKMIDAAYKIYSPNQSLSEIPYDSSVQTGKDSTEFLAGYHKGKQMSQKYPEGMNTVYKQGLDPIYGAYGRGRSAGYFEKHKQGGPIKYEEAGMVKDETPDLFSYNQLKPIYNPNSSQFAGSPYTPGFNPNGLPPLLTAKQREQASFDADKAAAEKWMYDAAPRAKGILVDDSASKPAPKPSPDYGSMVNNAIGLAPAVYDLFNANKTAKQYDYRDYTNPYEKRYLEELDKQRVNLKPLYDDVNRTAKLNYQRAVNAAGQSAGAAMAGALATQGNVLNQRSKLGLQEQEMNNQYRSQYAQALANAGLNRAQVKGQIRDINEMNEAKRTEYIGKGLEGASRWAQMQEKMKNEKGNDQMRMAALKDIFGEDFDEMMRAYSEIQTKKKTTPNGK